jgi:hypothetical protein
MPEAHRTPWWFHALAGALVAAFFLQSFFSSLIKSPTSDEPPHIAAGLSYVQKGVFIPNAQHPPLLKEMAGVSLLLGGIRLGNTPEVDAMLNERLGRGLEWIVGNDVIALGGPRKVMFRARLPFILLATLLALMIWVWGRQMLGDTAALGALFLFALDPTMIAHSQFVTTDVGMAAFATLFFFSLWNWLRRPATGRLLWCGVAMGLLLCSKFSAVCLLPVALVLVLAYALRRKRLAKAVGDFGVMSVVAALVIMGIYASFSGLAAYWQGFQSVYADSNPNYLAYMAGETQRRFVSYFALVWLLKEPLATIAAVVLGCVVVMRSRRFTELDKLFLFLPPLALFVACTIRAGNIGIRYLIPAFPFLYLAGGAGLAMLIESPSKWARGLAAVLCVWIAVAAAGIYPDHLSYFNEAACLLHDPARVGFDGGTECGPYWFDDSNTDWGQGLEQLRIWRAAHPDPRPIHLTYFGNFPPELYGIVPDARQFDAAAMPAPGLYVVSVKFVWRLPMAWLRTIRPVAIVGHALYVYDIRPSQSSR